MKKIILIVCFCFFATVNGQTVTTFAGSTQGYTDATGLASKFSYPFGVCPDNSGNLYVADRYNHKIRKIVIATGVTTTLAGATSGYADGIGTAAQFYEPIGICFDNNKYLYVSEFGNCKIRKIDITTGMVTTLAGTSFGYLDGAGSSAQFTLPFGICCDFINGNLYVADYGNTKIRKIEIATSIVSTVAGSTAGVTNGIGTNAKFNSPFGICTDFTNLYIADGSSNQIRKINLSTVEVTNFATMTNGLCYGIGIDYSGYLYVSDGDIKKIDVLNSATVSILAGSTSGYLDGSGTTAKFNKPAGLCVAGSNLYVADSDNGKIRKITLPTTSLGVSQNELPTTTSIYPNPNNGKFSINSNNEKVTQVQLFSLDGKLINTQKPNSLNPEIALPEISKGLYLITISLENGQESKSKIIIE